MKKNKLVLVLLFLIMAIVAGVVMFAKHQESGGVASGQTNESEPATSFFDFGGGQKIEEVDVDADNAEHTLGNIARDSAAIKEQFRSYQQESDANEKRFNQMTQLMEQMQRRNQLLEEQLAAQREQIDDVTEQGRTLNIDSLREALFSDMQSEIKKLVPENDADFEVSEPEVVEEDEGVTRIRSINMRLDRTGEPDLEHYRSLHDQSSKDNDTTSNSSVPESVAKKPEYIVDPRYTVFANSILNNGITVTHLIGRVPKDGDVGDPAPFKVLVGSENLQANGFKIPNLKGMLMSGSVFGDSVLKCVRTKITSATYIFEDGRGVTFPQSKAGSGDGGLGYLSDAYGNPCISGTFYSNRNDQLKKTFAAGVASGAASAFAASETESETDDNGNTILSVTGDKLKYVLGAGVAEGAGNVAEQLKDEFDIWDTVVVESGVRVAVHLEQTLELDQTSLQRKVEYVQTNSFDSFTD